MAWKDLFQGEQVVESLRVQRGRLESLDGEEFPPTRINFVSVHIVRRASGSNTRILPVPALGRRIDMPWRGEAAVPDQGIRPHGRGHTNC